MKNNVFIWAIMLLLASCNKGQLVKQGEKVAEKAVIETVAKRTISDNLMGRMEAIVGKDIASQLAKKVEANPELLNFLEKNGNMLNLWIYLNKQLPVRPLDYGFVKRFVFSDKYSKSGYFGGNKIENFVFKKGANGEVLIKSKAGQDLGKISCVEPPLVTLYESEARKGFKNMFANLHPFPNTQYDLAGAKYMTDSRGRIVESVFVIDKNYAQTPNIYYPKMITAAGKVKGALSGDDGGHLLGQQFGGSSTVINVVPMKASLNKGDYLRMERLWKSAADEGKTVKATVKLKYEDEATERPSWIITKYNIDGKEYEKMFEN